MKNNSTATMNELVANCQCHVKLDEMQLRLNRMRKNLLVRDERNAVQEQVMRNQENELKAAHAQIAELNELIARMNREQARSDEMLALGERP